MECSKVQAAATMRPLEKIDRLHIADMPDDVDRPLGHKVVDQQDVFGSVIDAKLAALRNVFHVAGSEALQARDVTVITRDDYRAVCSLVDRQAAAHLASARIVDVSDVRAVV